MKTLLALAALAISVPALASDVTSFYRSPYATPRGGGPAATSSSFYRTPYAQGERAAPVQAPAQAVRESHGTVAASRLAPPPKA
jgi:hypothetical protein